ncbi:MAG: hypothetical protein SFY92_07560 [Verrucomicrobiae bacterium]|nr:hypothetical protein [Verrucomicrobiae bacterium]
MSTFVELETILACDAIAHSSGKYTLVGVFDRIWAIKFPCTHGPLAIYLRLRLPLGQHKIEVQITDSDQRVIYKTQPPMEANVTLEDMTGEFPVGLAGVSFPLPDEYWVQCLVNGQIQANLSYRLVLMEAHPHPPGS